jgi:hypothetical protein
MFTAPWKVRSVVSAALVLACFCTTSANAQDGGGNSPPVITSLNAVQIPGQKFKISGTVADNYPASCVVSITGSATGSLQCDTSGAFSGVLDVPSLGAISAVASDGTLQSDPATLTLTNAAPTVTIQAIQTGLHTVRFSGRVTDEAPAGLVVRLSGIPGVTGVTATVQPDGTWSVSVGLQATSGNVTATVVDWYGQSGTAATSL